MMKSIRSYSELITFNDFNERYEYLKLSGDVGKETFGFDRFVNQDFYKSCEWRSVRDYVIVRDCGCDLGLDGYQIYGRIYIHHMNPISIEDIYKMSRNLLDPEYLICTTLQTHNAIHYGSKDLLMANHIERTRNDMCPWKH